MNEPIFESISPILSQTSLPNTTKNQLKVQNIENNNNKTKSKNEKSSTRRTKNLNSLASVTQPDHGTNSWFQ